MTMRYISFSLLTGCLLALLLSFLCCHSAFNVVKNIWYHAREHDIRVTPDYPGHEYFETRLVTTPPHERQQHELEALSALRAAHEMRSAGRDHRAERLFRHALALSPRQPDILIGYGEFLESSVGDLTGADQLYQQVLCQVPGHERALSNRRRTLPLVIQADLRQLDRVNAKLQRLSRVPDSDAALRRIKKEAYFQQIHHSSGIEGNTLSLAETRFVVETRMAVAGRSISELNEILGLDAAIKFINNTLIQRLGSIRLHDILQIHRLVMGHVEPLDAGQMRTAQVFVGQHRPPPPARLSPLMTAFVDWLNDPDTLALHPIKFAALAHYKLVYIHPFSDGNGRTSRLLMNLIMMQAGFPPVIIRRQERHLYYRCLQLANEGDVRPFIRFIADCAERTIDVYLWATDQHMERLAGDRESFDLDSTSDGDPLDSHVLQPSDSDYLIVRGQYNADPLADGWHSAARLGKVEEEDRDDDAERLRKAHLDSSWSDEECSFADECSGETITSSPAHDQVSSRKR